MRLQDELPGTRTHDLAVWVVQSSELILLPQSPLWMHYSHTDRRLFGDCLDRIKSAVSASHIIHYSLTLFRLALIADLAMNRNGNPPRLYAAVHAVESVTIYGFLVCMRSSSHYKFHNILCPLSAQPLPAMHTLEVE